MESRREVHLMVVANKDKRQMVQDAEGVGHLIGSYYEFTNVRVNKYLNYITYNNEEFEIDVRQAESNIEGELVIKLVVGKSCRVDNNSEYINFDKLRKVLIKVLKNSFKDIYITRDDISRELCKEAYPYINETENSLREFIINFMITKVGSEWWKYNIAESSIKKARERGKGEVFNSLINEDIYSIDFKDLAEIIFTNHSQYKSKNDIMQELKKCDTLEEFKKVRENSVSNWDKYFSDYFGENWHEKWGDLGDYRNSIAHNKLIDYNVLEKIKKLSSELRDGINKAFSKLKEFQYTPSEKLILEGKIIEFKGVTKKSLIEKLNKCGYNLDDINLIIKKYKEDNKEYITSVDIIRELNAGAYIVNQEINRVVGQLLHHFGNELKVCSTGGSLNIEDDNGDNSTSRIYGFD